jgi:diguanylate cyclase (GGDEF)-like protein
MEEAASRPDARPGTRGPRWPLRSLRRRRERHGDLERRLHVADRQAEALRSSAADLVSSKDLDAVLDRITARAGEALGADRAVLAVRTGHELERELFHVGFEDVDEAIELAERVAGGTSWAGDPTLAVADVTSARRHHGYLVAQLEEGSEPTSEEREVLSSHARYAAAALDAAAAAEEIRQQRETARMLLGLARSLVNASSEEEVASRIAEAVPSVVQADRSLVMLWNAEDEVFSVAASYGYSTDTQAAVRSLVVRRSDTPEATRMLMEPAPRFYDRSDPDEMIRNTMIAFGSSECAVVPIVAHESVLGVVIAIAAESGRGLRREPYVMERLAGLADQAATSLENARLLGELRRRAFVDELTGLPNNMLFRDRVGQALARSERREGRVGVLMLDLDHFKKVNDSLGPQVGNELLLQVASRLQGTVRAEDTVARLGADEFGVLLPEIGQLADAIVVAEKLLGSLRQPFTLADHTVFVTASMGIALHPEHGTAVETVLRNADTAVYRAKERGRDNYQAYASSMSASAFERLALEGELHRASGEGQLRAWYQPLVDLQTGGITGVEALVRWQHHTHGLLTPDRFLPLAEETGVVVEIDRWVMREACRQAVEWSGRGFGHLTIHVNVSGRSFQRPGLVEEVLEVLSETGLEPGRLFLEVSENVASHEAASTLAVLKGLKAHGVGVAIDDFGTGYSVLGRLRHFPLDKLKIDRSFVEEIDSDGKAPLVAAIVRMAHELGLEVVAEGVETEDQLDYLRVHGCDASQGFLFSRPVAAGDLERLLREPASASL